MNKKFLITSLIIFTVSLLLFFNLNSKNNTLNISNLSKNTVYIVFRETDSKNGLLSKEYNINSSKMTHVGIGFFKNGKFQILHIDNKKNSNKKNDIIIDSTEEFYNLNDCKVLSGEIWKYEKTLNEKELIELRNLIDSLYYKSQIKFDKKIDYWNDKNMYCSVLVSKTLEKIIPHYKVKLYKRKLNPIHSFVFKQDSITYLPVDYFTKLSYFKKVQQFKNNNTKNK